MKFFAKLTTFLIITTFSLRYAFNIHRSHGSHLRFRTFTPLIHSSSFTYNIRLKTSLNALPNSDSKEKVKSTNPTTTIKNKTKAVKRAKKVQSTNIEVYREYEPSTFVTNFNSTTIRLFLSLGVSQIYTNILLH